MNKNEIFQHYSRILDNMLDESLFFDTYFQNRYSMEDIEGSIDDVAVPEGIDICFGISRGCIIDNNYNYVVKFDVDCDNDGGSICERETDFYREAIRKGLEQYFAAAVYIGTYTKTINFYSINEIEKNLNWYDYDPIKFEEDFMKVEDNFGPIIPITISIPLYAYPKANNYCYSNLIEEEEERCKSIARCSNSPLRRRNLQIAMEFIHLYGKDEYERLSDFLELCDINDLHYKNMGFINGNLVIIDYGGYHSGDSNSNSYYSEY